MKVTAILRRLIGLRPPSDYTPISPDVLRYVQRDRADFLGLRKDWHNAAEQLRAERRGGSSSASAN